MLHAFWAKRKFLEIPNQKIFPLTCDFTVATCGGSHQRCSIKKSILENSAKFSGKHLYQSLFFNKVKGLSPATLLKKRLWHRCFPVNFVKFLRTAFLENTSQLLLKTAVSFTEARLILKLRHLIPQLRATCSDLLAWVYFSSFSCFQISNFGQKVWLVLRISLF